MVYYKTMKKKKKMTLREYAEQQDIDLTKYFLDENLNMSMQSYLKKIGLPSAAKVFRMLNNERP